MKRYYVATISLIFGVSILMAQDETDVLRLSQNYTLGTARSAGMGGAVGALGGDFSSISLNPAGLGIYRGSEFSFTPSFSWNVTSSQFLNNTNEDIKRNLGITNIGYVSHNDLNRESGWISTSFAFGYSSLNNYNQRTFMAGINNQNSFLDDFSNLSDDPNSSEFLFYKDLAFQDSLLVDDVNPGEYTNDFKIDGYGQYQERLLTTSGSTGELSFSFGANYNHTLYLGALLGIHRVRFDRSFIHTEDDPTDKIFYVDKFIFYEDLRTRGYGFNLKLGAIARATDFLRIGTAIHFPSIYFLDEEFTTDLTAYYDNYNPKTASSPLGESSYRIITPFKFIGSATATIGKIGLLNLDYEYIDYSTAKIESESERYVEANDAVKTMYKSASNIRAGGEIRFNSMYLRAGYSFYGSPYALVDPKANETHNNFSGGLGFRSRFVFVDLGFSQRSFDQAYYMYPSQAANGAVNSSKANTFLLTLGYKF
jgi:hypothetical protein